MRRMLFTMLLVSLLAVSMITARPLSKPPSGENGPAVPSVEGTRLSPWVDVPTWYAGDVWVYDIDGQVDFDIYTISLTGTNTIRVLGNTTLNGYPVYITNTTLTATGSSPPLITSLDLLVYIDSYVNISDLSVVQVNSSGYMDVTTMMGSFAYSTLTNQTFSPAREEFDFPIQVSDEWEFNVTVDEISDGIPSTHVDRNRYQCSGTQVVSTAYGSLDCLVIDDDNSQTRYYCPSVRNDAKSTLPYSGMGTSFSMNSELKSHTNATPASILDLELDSSKNIYDMGEWASLMIDSPIDGDLTVTAPGFGYVNTSTITSAATAFMNIYTPSIRDNTPSISDYASFGIIVNVSSPTANLTQVITIATKAPDLYTELSFIYLPPGGMYEGEDYQINLSVYSFVFTGDITVTSVRVDMYIDNVFNSTVVIPSILPNSYENATFGFRQEDPGSYNLRFEVDPLDAIAEVYEHNNNASVTATVNELNHAPFLKGYAPAEDSLSINESKSQSFNVTPQDPDADIMGIHWLIDGIEQDHLYNATLITFQSDYLGDNSSENSPFNITVLVEDLRADSLNVSRWWTLEVVDVNRPPQINDFSPTTPVVAYENETIFFEADCFDLDGDKLEYYWALCDGINETCDHLDYGYNNTWVKTNYLNYPSAGEYQVKLYINDSKSNITHTWDLTVLDFNRAPVVAIEPLVNIHELNSSSNITLRANATDPDGDSVTFTWFDQLEGYATLEVGNTTDVTLNLPAGNHTITVEAFDGKNGTGTASLSFSVEEYVPPVVDDDEPYVAKMVNVTGTSPEDGAAGVKVDVVIKIKVEGGIVNESKLQGAITIKQGAQDIAFTPEFSSTNEYQISLTPGADLENNKTYTVTVSQLDLFDRIGWDIILDSDPAEDDYVFSFTTKAATGPGPVDDDDPDPDPKESLVWLWVLLAVIALVIVVAVVLAVLFIMKKNKKDTEPEEDYEPPDYDAPPAPGEEEWDGSGDTGIPLDEDDEFWDEETGEE